MLFFLFKFCSVCEISSEEGPDRSNALPFVFFHELIEPLWDPLDQEKLVARDASLPSFFTVARKISRVLFAAAVCTQLKILSNRIDFFRENLSPWGACWLEYISLFSRDNFWTSNRRRSRSALSSMDKDWRRSRCSIIWLRLRLHSSRSNEAFTAFTLICCKTTVILFGSVLTWCTSDIIFQFPALKPFLIGLNRSIKYLRPFSIAHIHSQQHPCVFSLIPCRYFFKRVILLSKLSTKNRYFSSSARIYASFSLSNEALTWAITPCSGL